jgi:hypothetical protein
MAGQQTIRLFRFPAVLQPLFLNLSRSIVKDRDLLKTRMKITAYNQHSQHHGFSSHTVPQKQLPSSSNAVVP